MQVDVDTKGNDVEINNGTGLAAAGRLTDSTFLSANFAAGYWLKRPQCNCMGVAPGLELHYNTSLNSADSVSVNNLQVGNFHNNVDSLSLTVGSHFTLRNSRLSIGYIAPLGSERQNNSGLRVMFDYHPVGRQQPISNNLCRHPFRP